MPQSYPGISSPQRSASLAPDSRESAGRATGKVVDDRDVVPGRRKAQARRPPAEAVATEDHGFHAQVLLVN